MDKAAQERIRTILEGTLDDDRLSRGESEDVKEIAAELASDRTAIAFLRNQAFDLAKERVEQSPRAVLAWLDRVDKIADHALAAPGAAGARSTIAFTPGDGCLKVVRGAISGARRALDVCVFTITDDRITGAILDAHRRGVAVRIISDDEKALDAGSDIRRLREAGVPVRTDRAPDHMHHKFALVDGQTLVNGSYNWTRGATSNHENVHATTSPRVVKAYAGEFERLWADFA